MVPGSAAGDRGPVAESRPMRKTARHRPSPGPEPRAPLTADRIHAAALALVDEAGVEALSMRKLATALGVDPMSIYHHVPGKQALLHGVFQRVLRELPIPRAAGLSWQDVLRTLARRFAALARRHPRLMPALLASPFSTPREREIHGAIDAALARAGFGVDDRRRLAQAIYTFASGLAGVAANGPGGRPVFDGSGARRAPRAGGDAPRARTDPAADLEFSVELMIAGIEALAQRSAM
jgi:AcrR family transcriptional regulator